MRLFRPCFFAGWIYPEAVFRIKTERKVLYLTFDDGPDPDSTPQLLDILQKHGIKALFFCNGEEAGKYHDLLKQIKARGHIVGNHGYAHLNGWTTSSERYTDDANKAAAYTSYSLFRPPYGRLTLKQYRELKNTYRIFFWDLMPYDFDSSFGIDNTLRILKKKVRPGSVIVLHDTSKSVAIKIIEEFINYSLGAGYRFGTI